MLFGLWWCRQNGAFEHFLVIHCRVCMSARLVVQSNFNSTLYYGLLCFRHKTTHYHKPDHSKPALLLKFQLSCHLWKGLPCENSIQNFFMGIWLHFSARDIAWPWRNVAQQNAKSKLQNMQNCWLSDRKKQRCVAKKKLNDVALLHWGTRSHLAKVHPRNNNVVLRLSEK
jgi:hypothetical protein